jgi:hypothetical protein
LAKRHRLLPGTSNALNDIRKENEWSETAVVARFWTRLNQHQQQQDEGQQQQHIDPFSVVRVIGAAGKLSLVAFFMSLSLKVIASASLIGR